MTKEPSLCHVVSLSLSSILFDLNGYRARYVPDVVDPAYGLDFSDLYVDRLPTLEFGAVPKLVGREACFACGYSGQVLGSAGSVCVSRVQDLVTGGLRVFRPAHREVAFLR